MLLKIGQQITVRALHADGRWYRKWETTVERLDGDGLVTLSPPGGLTCDAGKGASRLENYLRNYYWFDRFYNLLEEYDPGGTPTQIYINVGSPPTLTDAGFDWTDHELDVSKYIGRPARLLDEDEFAEAAQKYNYSPAFQRQCYAAAREALALAEVWPPPGLSGI